MCPSCGTNAPMSKSLWKPERGARGNRNKKRPDNRTLVLYVFRIKCLRYEFVFSRQRTHAYDNTNASGSHFIQSLIGYRGSSEIVFRAHHKVCCRQVVGMNVLSDQFHGIRGYHCKTKLNGQLGYHLFPLLYIRTNHDKYFVLFCKPLSIY